MLEELAERIEKLDGPDREVDAEIALANGWSHDEFPCQNVNGSTEMGDLWFPKHFTDEDKEESIASYRESVRMGIWPEIDPPAYTASLDAAMTLVPEGWYLTHAGGLTLFTARVDKANDNPNAFEVGISKEGLALALCAAALRALAKSASPTQRAG